MREKLITVKDFILLTWIGRGVGLLILVGVGVLAWLAWWLGSPLFVDREVNEEFPLSVSAQVPEGMTRVDVEQMMEDARNETREVEESTPVTPDMPEITLIKSGNFRDVTSFYTGRGKATVYDLGNGESVLRFEDFEVTNGPDLHVLLSKSPNLDSSSEVRNAEYVDLGQLKGNIGNQNYLIPTDLDITEFNSVVIYCRPFHVLFSWAPIS